MVNECSCLAAGTVSERGNHGEGSVNPNLEFVFWKGSGSSTDLYFANAKETVVCYQLRPPRGAGRNVRQLLLKQPINQLLVTFEVKQLIIIHLDEETGVSIAGGKYVTCMARKIFCYF